MSSKGMCYIRLMVIKIIVNLNTNLTGYMIKKYYMINARVLEVKHDIAL